MSTFRDCFIFGCHCRHLRGLRLCGLHSVSTLRRAPSGSWEVAGGLTGSLHAPIFAWAKVTQICDEDLGAEDQLGAKNPLDCRACGKKTTLDIGGVCHVEPAALAWLPSTLHTYIGLHSQSQISESDRIQDSCSRSDFQVRLPINQVYATNLQCT